MPYFAPTLAYFTLLSLVLCYFGLWPTLDLLCLTLPHFAPVYLVYLLSFCDLVVCLTLTYFDLLCLTLALPCFVVLACYQPSRPSYHRVQCLAYYHWVCPAHQVPPGPAYLLPPGLASGLLSTTRSSLLTTTQSGVWLTTTGSSVRLTTTRSGVQFTNYYQVRLTTTGSSIWFTGSSVQLTNYYQVQLTTTRPSLLLLGLPYLLPPGPANYYHQVTALAKYYYPCFFASLYPPLPQFTCSTYLTLLCFTERTLAEPLHYFSSGPRPLYASTTTTPVPCHLFATSVQFLFTWPPKSS